MRLIYTAENSGFDEAGQYRNPRYFDRIETATEVVVIGNWPEVVEAYKAAGVSVADGKASRKPRKQKEG